MTGYKDDEFCHFCGEYLIYLNQVGWMCPNHNNSIIYKYVKATTSYSFQIRIVKNGLGIISSSNSIEEIYKTSMVEFYKIDKTVDSYNNMYLEKLVGKENLPKLINNDRHYYSNHYNTIVDMPSLIKINPDNLDECIKRLKKLIPFS